jgi:RNA polymerase sigma-70 factor (ECF subfamily)
LKEYATRSLPAAVRSRIGADDLVQEAVISGIAHLDRFEFRHQGALMAYLRTSVRHKIVDELRKASRRRAAGPFTEAVDLAPSPLQQVIHKQNIERYSTALARLGDRDQQIIVLRVEQRLPYADVAVRLRMSSAHAVRMAVKRALARLAYELRRSDAVRTGRSLVPERLGRIESGRSTSRQERGETGNSHEDRGRRRHSPDVERPASEQLVARES